MTAQLTFNEKDFIKNAQQHFKKTIEDTGDRMQEMLTEEKRPYPRTTYRKYGRGKTGIVASSPRDVVDRGTLVDSFDIEVETLNDLIKITISWGASHSIYIYFGTDKQPEYPWVKLLLQQVDLEKEFWRRYR